MTITITAFERSPDGGKGLARDTRVRWALEEVGQPYEVRLVSFRAMKEPAHLALHPFGQIPTYEEGDLALFETGAIVFHIAERHAGLLPDDANARARAITWMFAALNTVEPPILELGNARLLEGDKPWNKERLPLVEDRVRNRLGQLSARLGDADWLDGAFSAGDLMMVSVLLRLRSSGILDEYPNLAAYVARGEARPAYKRAFDAQLAVNAGKPPTRESNRNRGAAQAPAASNTNPRRYTPRPVHPLTGHARQQCPAHPIRCRSPSCPTVSVALSSCRWCSFLRQPPGGPGRDLLHELHGPVGLR